MEFQLTDEQKLLKKTVREFCDKEIASVVREIDQESKIPDQIIKKLALMNLLGMTVSGEYGGVEAEPITVGVIVEELARADVSCAIPTFFLVQCAWGYILDKYGSTRIKQDILPKVTKGSAFLGIAATEPDVGSDLANMKTVAKKSEDRYIVSGEKLFISGINEVMNQLPEGGGYLTLVRTSPEKGVRGMSLFYIPLKGTDGITTTILEDWGRKGISSGGFVLDGVELSRDNLIGEEDRGFYIAMEGFDYARAIISVVCCGSAMRSLERSMEHIKSRRVFGQPIGRYEGVQFKLAEHWARLDAVRLLGYKALWAYHKEQTEKSFSRFEVTRLCAEAKLLAAPSAFEAINDAIQWFGAYGYTTDCELELALKGVRSYFWAEGSLEIMKLIVARELLGRDFLAYR